MVGRFLYHESTLMAVRSDGSAVLVFIPHSYFSSPVSFPFIFCLLFIFSPTPLTLFDSFPLYSIAVASVKKPSERTVTGAEAEREWSERASVNASIEIHVTILELTVRGA